MHSMSPLNIAFCPTPSTHTTLWAICIAMVTWLPGYLLVTKCTCLFTPVIHCTYRQSALPVMCSFVILSIFIARVECSAPCCIRWPSWCYEVLVTKDGVIAPRNGQEWIQHAALCSTRRTYWCGASCSWGLQSGHCCSWQGECVLGL